MPRKKRKKLHYAWIILFGVILVRGFAGGGINTVSGLFLSPVSRDIGVGIGSLSIYFSIISIVMIIWLPAAGKLIHRFDIRIMALTGAVLMIVPFIAFGSMYKLYGWYLLAVPYAMGSTILVNLLGPILINRWFSKNAGLMLGIQMAFVGLFGAVFQPLASAIIVQRGWRSGYRMIGWIAFAAVIFSAIFILKNKPEDKKLLPYGISDISVRKADNILPSSSVEIDEKTAVRSISFYLLLLFMISITGVGVFTQHIPTYGSILGYSIQKTGLALSYASVGNAAGSVAIGIISDKIGSLKTCYGMIAIGIISVTGFIFSDVSFLIFGVSAFLFGLTTSGIMVLAPILTISYYGKKDYEKIFAKVSMGAPLASVFLIPAYGFVYDWFNHYVFVLLGMLVLLVIAAVSIAIGWKNRCTLEGCPSFGWGSKTGK